MQVQDFNISDIFSKIQNLKKWKMKALTPFLPRNLKLHSTLVFFFFYLRLKSEIYNILDLVFTNTSEVISGYSTIVNRKFSDHNILRVRLNYKDKNEKKTERKNPYPNNIYKYDLMNATEEDWIRHDVLLSKLSEDFDNKSEG